MGRYCGLERVAAKDMDCACARVTREVNGYGFCKFVKFENGN